MIPARIISDFFLNSEVLFLPYKTYKISEYDQTNFKPLITSDFLDSLNKGSKVLLVDDIADSGSTLSRITHVIQSHYHQQAINYTILTSSIISKMKWIPNIVGKTYDNNNWIVFPWEKNEFSKG